MHHDRPISGVSGAFNRLSFKTSLTYPEEPNTPPRTPTPPRTDRQRKDRAKTISVRDQRLPLPSIQIHGDDSLRSEDEDEAGWKGKARASGHERTRSWAEEVGRSRHSRESRNHDGKSKGRRCPKEQGNGQLSPVSPYAQSSWSVSSDVIDSLVEELNPGKRDSSHLPTAASVIQANRRKSYQLLGNSESSDDSLDSSAHLNQARRRPDRASRRLQERDEMYDIGEGSSRRERTRLDMPDRPKKLSLTILDPHSRSTPASSPAPKANAALPPSPARSPVASAARPVSSILSIEDIIRRHSPAAADAEAAAKAKAKKEIDSARPANSTASPPLYEKRFKESQTMSIDSLSRSRQMASPKPNPSASRPLETKYAPPTPARTTSLPAMRPVPIGISSRKADSPAPAEVTVKAGESTSTPSGNSVFQGIQMSQALLEQLEHKSTASSRSSNRRVSFQPSAPIVRGTTPTRSAKLAKRKSLPTVPTTTTTSSPLLAPETDAQLYARYLRSPHLNKVITLPRAFPDRPLHVSFAEVGSPTGHPIIIFLGLGCVRYLIALFDDIAQTFNLRLICIDRWGVGKTDNIPQEQRDVLAWAGVVERILGQLGVDEFQILAHSAGAPYALACALRMKGRVRGKIHLLAPWVSADIDGGYKWLKWVPNGLIKSATAAEWRLQSYLLGKPPPMPARSSNSNLPHPHPSQSAISSEDVFTRVDSPEHSHTGSPQGSPARPRGAGGRLIRRASRILSPRSIEPLRAASTPSPEFKRRMTTSRPIGEPSGLPQGGSATVKAGRNDSDPSLSSTDSYPILRTPPRNKDEQGRTPVNGKAARTLKEDEEVDWDLIEGFEPPAQYLSGETMPSRPAPVRHESAPPPAAAGAAAVMTTATIGEGQPRAPTGAAFTLALLQASHAECEPGTTADLLSIVLNRSSGIPTGPTPPSTHSEELRMTATGGGSGSGSGGGSSGGSAQPWGYGYTDITHPIRIWYGAEDDKISEKSMRWMERCMKDVELKVVDGEGHGLMTSAGVMWDVFESLGREARGFRRHPDADTDADT